MSAGLHCGWAVAFSACALLCAKAGCQLLLRVFVHLWEHTVQGLLVLLYLQKIPLQALDVGAPVPRPPTVPFLALEHVSHRLRMTGSNNRLSMHTAPT